MSPLIGYNTKPALKATRVLVPPQFTELKRLRRLAASLRMSERPRINSPSMDRTIGSINSSLSESADCPMVDIPFTTLMFPDISSLQSFAEEDYLPTTNDKRTLDLATSEAGSGACFIAHISLDQCPKNQGPESHNIYDETSSESDEVPFL